MTAEELFDSLINVLDSEPARYANYWNATADTDWDSTDWTARMTFALVKAVDRAATGTHDFIRAAKNHPDPYGRSEYLNIDVMGLVDDWTAPVVAIEHENNAGAPKLRYCLWKLLVVGAPVSVLVCYIDSSGHFPTCFTSVDALRQALDEVRSRFPNQAAHLVVGEWNGAVGTSWRDVFSLHLA